MGKKKGLKRGSKEWQERQLYRFLQSQQKEKLNINDKTLENLNKEFRLLQEVKERINARED